MSASETLLLAFALAMDSFAVSVSLGLARAAAPGRVARVALSFGFFQWLMATLGWLGGAASAQWVESFDHWLAFGLLAFVGGKMIYESFHDCCGESRDVESWPTLLVLSIAVSIDSLAAGFSLAAVAGGGVWRVFAAVGAASALCSAVGMKLARRIGEVIGRRAELLGGLVLIGIGAHILYEHLVT